MSSSSSSVALTPREPLGLPGPRLLEDEGVARPAAWSADAPRLWEVEGPGVPAGDGEVFVA